MIPGTKVDTGVAYIVRPLTEVGNIGESRFEGKVDESGFEHFELQVVLWDDKQEVGNFGQTEPRKFRTGES